MSYDVVTGRNRTTYPDWLAAMRVKLGIIKRWPGAPVRIEWNGGRSGRTKKAQREG